MLINKEIVKDRIQRRIGVTLCAISGTIAFVNIVTQLSEGIPVVDALKSSSVSILIVISLFGVISIVRPHQILKVVQVFIFFCVGVVAGIMSPPGALVGVAFVVLALILAIQYEFLKAHFYLKIAIIVLLYCVPLFVTAVMKMDFGVLRAVNTVLFTVGYLYLIWIMFKEEIEAYITETTRLKSEIASNRVFVDFGKNVSGLVHNLRNKLFAIDGVNKLISEEASPEIRELLGMQKRVIGQVVDLIDNLMFAVRARQTIKASTISLSKLTLGVSDIFQANEEFAHNVTITHEYISDDLIYASPLQVSQIIENLIMNAWESMENSKGNSIDIRTVKCGEYVKLSIEDEGNGIQFCDSCKKKKCLNCGEFKVGRTTRKSGTGVGMVYVQEAVAAMGGKLVLNSRLNEGTTVDVLFPSEKMRGSEPIVSEKNAG